MYVFLHTRARVCDRMWAHTLIHINIHKTLAPNKRPLTQEGEPVSRISGDKLTLKRRFSLVIGFTSQFFDTEHANRDTSKDSQSCMYTLCMLHVFRLYLLLYTFWVFFVLLRRFSTSRTKWYLYTCHTLITLCIRAMLRRKQQMELLWIF